MIEMTSGGNQHFLSKTDMNNTSWIQYCYYYFRKRVQQPKIIYVMVQLCAYAAIC